MFRFFVQPEEINNQQVRISGEDVFHLRKTLRFKPGDRVIICDGQGKDYLVELVHLAAAEVKGIILETYQSLGEPELEVTLLQGLPKGDKMDLIVQKCTELGIQQIIPVETKRTIVRLNPEKAGRRVARWQKIAKEASKQADRGQIPIVSSIFSWQEALEFVQNQGFDLLILPWEDATDFSLGKLLKEWGPDDQRPGKIAYLIGPEGGLTLEEITDFRELGGRSVTLGPRILRTETAGFVVLTVLMYEFRQLEGCGIRCSG